jgi:hypothetical protein
MQKYKNVKTSIDGIVFDSKKEATRYIELKLLERAREITDLKLQPKFVLQEAFKKNGTNYPAITYKADFMYTDMKTGLTVIEDTKGFITKDFRLKQKMFEKIFPDMTIKLI